MTIPKYNEMYREFLECVKDGKQYCKSDVISYIADYRSLSNEELLLKFPSGSQSIFPIE